MDKKRINSNDYWKESVHTQLSYWLLVMATGVELILGLIHIDELFGQMCLVEALFGLSGLLFLDLLHGRKTIYPKKFKPIHKNTFFRFGVTFGVIVLIQYLFQIVPLITSTEMALGIVFCAPVEEYFFRGIIMELTFRIGEKSKDKFTVWKYSPKKKKPDKEMSYIELGGILLSAVMFATLHINYYGDARLIGMVFVGGLWLSLVYWWGRDLTPIILAHFLLNITFVFQYYQVTGL